MQNLVGTSLGPYQIIERIALGGMAAVYLARQPSTRREVAVKVLALTGNADAVEIERFEREGRLLAGLQNPHILPVFDCGISHDYAWMVTPLIRHGDLEERLARWGEPLPLGEIRRIGLQLADALSCAHAAGIVHRDLKPANVLIDGRGNCLLSDFGIAKGNEARGLTAAGMVIGTPDYMSPEQSRGEAVDGRSDLYCLGAILFELATFQKPFPGRTPAERMIRRESEDAPAPSTLNPALPPAFDRVVLRAMQRDPAARFGTADEFAQALREAIAESDTGTVEAGLPTAPTPPPATPPIAPATMTPPPFDAQATRPSPLPPNREQPLRSTAGTSKGPWLALAGVLGLLAVTGVGWALWPAARPVAAPPAVAAPSAPAPSPAPTPAPVARSTARLPPSEPVLVDDFDEAAVDGGYNEARWQMVPGAKATTASEHGGVLTLSTRETLHGLYATLPGAVPPGTIWARARMPGAPKAAQGTIGVVLSAYAAGGTAPVWWASCYLFAEAGKNAATPTCGDIHAASYPKGAPIALGDWSELTLRRAGDGYDLAVGDTAVGHFALPPADPRTALTWYVSLTGWSSDGKPVSGEFDAVRVDR
jgi:serine/threonine-protein kinase